MAQGKQFFFEDLPVGFSFETEPVVFTQDKMISFAGQFDPQYFHTEPEAAESSMFGGLIASGWHIAAATMQRIVSDKNGGFAGIVGLELNHLRWPNPVRPGDAVSVRVSVIEARESKTYPKHGLLRLAFEASNQNGAPVQTYEGSVLVERRVAS